MERRNSLRTLAKWPCVGAVALVVSTVIGVDPAATQAYPLVPIFVNCADPPLPT